jgi:hypothetical protein
MLFADLIWSQNKQRLCNGDKESFLLDGNFYLLFRYISGKGVSKKLWKKSERPEKGRLEFRHLIHDEKGDYVTHHSVQTTSGTHPASHYMGSEGSSLG